MGDPSYFPGKVRTVGRVVRAIAIMNHPIPNTDNAHSVQIILPQKQVGRKSDMYVFCCSYAHNIASKGEAGAEGEASGALFWRGAKRAGRGWVCHRLICTCRLARTDVQVCTCMHAEPAPPGLRVHAAF